MRVRCQPTCCCWTAIITMAPQRQMGLLFKTAVVFLATIQVSSWLHSAFSTTAFAAVVRFVAPTRIPGQACFIHTLDAACESMYCIKLLLLLCLDCSAVLCCCWQNPGGSSCFEWQHCSARQRGHAVQGSISLCGVRDRLSCGARNHAGCFRCCQGVQAAG